MKKKEIKKCGRCAGPIDINVEQFYDCGFNNHMYCYRCEQNNLRPCLCPEGYHEHKCNNFQKSLKAGVKNENF